MRRGRPAGPAWLGMLLVGPVLLAAPEAASAQPVPIPSMWGGDVLSRARLTGDWFGLRDEMGKKGVVFDADLRFLRERLHLGLDREDAIEMFYNAALTPWLNTILDLQVIDPALTKTLDSSGRLKNVDTTVVVGGRLYARF